MPRYRLREAREAADLSQAELAELIGAEQKAVSAWETGTQRPQPGHRRRVREQLNNNDPELFRNFEDDGEETGARTTEPPTRETQPDSASAPPQVSVPSESRLWVPYVPTLQDFIANNLTTRLQHIAHTDYATPDEMTIAIQSALKEFDMHQDTNPNYEITRRSALAELAALPLIALGQRPDTRHYEEMLRYCAAALEACWQLYRGSDPIGTQYAFECVCAYVPMLEAIAKDSSQHRKETLDLAAQYALLQTLLGWSCIGAGETVIHAQKALSLSKESGNILLRLSAHSKLSWTYLQSGNHTKALETMQEGEYALKCHQHAKRRAPLPLGVIANFYSGYSLAQVDNGIDPDTALGIATDSEPLKERIALVKFTTTDQWWEAARVCCSKRDPEQAMKWLGKLIDTEALIPCIADLQQSPRGLVGTFNILTDALLQSKKRDMGQVIKVWTASIEGAKALKSEQRYRDAMTNFAIMRALYSGEQAIRDLIPQTAHW